MMSRRTVGDRLVMSPMEPLVAGGAAEAFERHVQQLFRSGYRHLVVDLSGVPVIDSAGIRAFVRGHTSAQRVGGTLRLAGRARGRVARPGARASGGRLRDVRVGRGGAHGRLAVANHPHRRRLAPCSAWRSSGPAIRWPLELSGISDTGDEAPAGQRQAGLRRWPAARSSSS